jgi:hypothetical protein
MGFLDVAVVEVRCDACGQVGVDDEDARWFTGRDAAQKILAGFGWMFANDAVTCEGCVQKAACTLVGHDWGEWTDRTYAWYVGRTRTCRACDTTEGDPPLPADCGGVNTAGRPGFV